MNGSDDPLRILQISNIMDVLMFLAEHDGCTKMEMYRCVSYNSAMAGKVRMLEESGMIAQTADGRATRVSLTERGRRVAELLVRIRDTMESGRRPVRELPLFISRGCEPVNMTLKFGVPNKGRLNERTIELLTRSGLDLGEEIGRKLYVKARNQDVEILFVRAQDIPEFIAKGAIDIGITGEDQVAEAGVDIVKKLELGFGYCHMALAVPEESGIGDASGIADGTRIATSYPRIAETYFRSLGKDVNIIVVSGAAEIMPYLGIADCIVDLVSTGSTLKMNRMVEAGRILDSQACVFTSEGALEAHGREIEELVDSIDSVIGAESRRYLMANVPRDRVAQAEAIVPGLEGPTILEIAGRGDFVALHAVVDAADMFRIITDLKRIGAKGILTTEIQRLVNRWPTGAS